MFDGTSGWLKEQFIGPDLGSSKRRGRCSNPLRSNGKWTGLFKGGKARRLWAGTVGQGICRPPTKGGVLSHSPIRERNPAATSANPSTDGPTDGPTCSDPEPHEASEQSNRLQAGGEPRPPTARLVGRRSRRTAGWPARSPQRAPGRTVGAGPLLKRLRLHREAWALQAPVRYRGSNASRAPGAGRGRGSVSTVAAYRRYGACTGRVSHSHRPGGPTGATGSYQRLLWPVGRPEAEGFRGSRLLATGSRAGLVGARVIRTDGP